MGRDCYSLPADLRGKTIKDIYATDSGKNDVLRRFDARKTDSLAEKIKYSEEIVKAVVDRFNKKYHRCAVSCSFGKDSMAILHLVRKIKPDVKVVFANTGVEHKETLRYKKRMVEEWNLNFAEVKPIKSFWKCVDDYGLPDFRSHGGTPKCCNFLKEKPLKDYYKKNYIRAVFLGIPYDESWTRRQVMIQYGEVYQTGDGLTKAHPIAFWTTQQVFEYSKIMGIPLNPIYEKLERCGCRPCTGHMGWIKQIQKTDPAMYKKIQHLKGQSLVEDWEER